MSVDGARRAAEIAARHSYGRLLALLVARTRDISAAEDALADAFAAALDDWPRQGVPDHPDAWLMTVARNRLFNAVRHRAVVDTAHEALRVLADEGSDDIHELPDERLRLLFVCAHPAIDPAVRTPLMLQVVLGLDAHRIGAAFLVAGPAMGQRLVRAKARIRDSGLRFELPAADDLPERLHDVLGAIYAAYGISFDAIAGADPGAPDLAEESIFLARLLATLMPSEPEVKGLLALMLYCEARRPARRAADGRFIPLRSQDPRLWRRDLIIEAENLLTEAARHGSYGRFQCEAAIQSVHVQRPLTGQVNHDALIMLYRLLATRSPSVGAQVGLAAALLEAGASADALAALDALAPTDVADYQPYWVTRAAVMRVLGRPADHRSALQTALGLTQDEALRRHLGGSQDG